jgi:hypothetical protein
VPVPLIQSLPWLMLCAVLGSACVTAVPSLELGTGELEFEALDDGDTIYVIHGPQGGYHLLASLRVGGVEPGTRDDLGDPDNPTMVVEVHHQDRQLVVNGLFTQGLAASVPASGSFSHEVLGRFAILDIADDSELDGEEIRFLARLSPVDGPELSDEHLLTVAPHPLN